MSLTYVDSSSLLKLLWNEPESHAVRLAVASETRIVVSVLTELEVEVQLRARHLAGSTTRARYRAYRTRLASLQTEEPFSFVDLPSSLLRVAIDQHVSSSEHCRTLDRLHLAAMHLLGCDRLMTNDLRQASAARALGHEVVAPGA